MKVQCPVCREIVEMTNFTTTSAGLTFTCSGCGDLNFLANPKADGPPEPAPAVRSSPQAEAPADAAADEAPADTAAEEELICPKCGHGQQDSYACHRCGLVFSRFDPDKLPPDPIQASTLWKEIELMPDDQSLHDAFLDECKKLSRLDFATRQYRRLARNPAHRAMADEMLQQVARIGQAQIAPAAAKPESRDRGRITKYIVWAIALAVVGLGAYYLLSMSSQMGTLGR